MMMLLGIALLVGGMAVSVGAPAEARDARLIADRGIDTTATITDLSIRRSPGRGGGTYAVADVEYEDEFGLPQESSGIIYCGEPEDVAVGDRVEVTYDPEEEADPQFAECEQSQEITIPLVIGIVVLAAGTVVLVMNWRARGWRRRWWGIPILVVGLVFAGASFEDECECQEFVYTGAALAVIGIAPLVAPRKPAMIEMPEGTDPPDPS